MGIKAAGRRLAHEAYKSGLFIDTWPLWDRNRLQDEVPKFFYNNRPILNRKNKGFGFWLWKPAIIQSVLNNMQENEIAVFLDAGCQLNVTENSINRFYEYCKFLESNDGLFMELKAGEFGFSNVTEAAWTKKQTRLALDPEDRFADTNQYQSGIIFLKNTNKIREFIGEWLKMCQFENYSLLHGPSSDELEGAHFISHRWEQSIISLLAKKYELAAIPDETYWFPNWILGVDFPIWAMRNRSGGDAFRRNPWDLIQIGAARVERNINDWLNESFGRR
jgi:hypothetical protein